MSFWRTLFGLGAVAGAAALTAAAIRKVEKLDEERDGDWTAMAADLDADLSYPEPAERPTVYGAGPIVFPPVEVEQDGKDHVSAALNHDFVSVDAPADEAEAAAVKAATLTEEAPKKRRGRPAKNPAEKKPTAKKAAAKKAPAKKTTAKKADAAAADGTAAPAKRRGRPPKKKAEEPTAE